MPEAYEFDYLIVGYGTLASGFIAFPERGDHRSEGACGIHLGSIKTGVTSNCEICEKSIASERVVYPLTHSVDRKTVLDLRQRLQALTQVRCEIHILVEE